MGRETWMKERNNSEKKQTGFDNRIGPLPTDALPKHSHVLIFLATLNFTGQPSVASRSPCRSSGLLPCGRSTSDTQVLLHPQPIQIRIMVPSSPQDTDCGNPSQILSGCWGITGVKSYKDSTQTIRTSSRILHSSEYPEGSNNKGRPGPKWAPRLYLLDDFF